MLALAKASPGRSTHGKPRRPVPGPLDGCGSIEHASAVDIVASVHRPEAPPQTNLPAPITSFIGRTTELAEVQRCLAGACLISLVGAGGVGNTRLALRVAEGGGLPTECD